MVEAMMVEAMTVKAAVVAKPEGKARPMPVGAVGVAIVAVPPTVYRPAVGTDVAMPPTSAGTPTAGAMEAMHFDDVGPIRSGSGRVLGRHQRRGSGRHSRCDSEHTAY
jgi:hypothetical protein